MPYGCSLWPAYWSYGTASWPADGEIDILEGVNNQVTLVIPLLFLPRCQDLTVALMHRNAMTLHTGPQCFLNENPTSGSASTPAFSGNVLSTSCESSSSSNTGCGIGDPDPSSYGAGFNKAGGGVFAHLWNHDGIKIWRFKRSSIPQDITSGNPDPSTWPIPIAFWSNTGCDVASHFRDHSLVIDTTLCGDWAGNVYGSSGCPGTCAQAVSEASNFGSKFVLFNAPCL